MVAVLYSMNSFTVSFPSPFVSQVLMISSASSRVMVRDNLWWVSLYVQNSVIGYHLASRSTNSWGSRLPSPSSTALNNSSSNFGSSVRVPWKQNWVFMSIFKVCYLQFSLSTRENLENQHNSYQRRVHWSCPSPQLLDSLSFQNP